MAICQTATRTEDRFLFLNETSFFGLHPSSKDLVHRPFGELKGLDRERAGSLAIDLQSDFNPYAVFNAISHQSDLGRDRYMDKSATYHVLRFANIAILMWDMPESRARKIFANPCGNNPLAAFGILVLPPAPSSHTRLAHMRALEEAHRFLVLYARYAFPSLKIHFEPQSLPDGH